MVGEKESLITSEGKTKRFKGTDFAYEEINLLSLALRNVTFLNDVIIV